MPNNFKKLTLASAPAVVGTPDTVYTVQSGSTLVVQKLSLCNIHTSQIAATVKVHSSTAHAGQTANTPAFLVKDVPIPSRSSLILDKMNLNVGDYFTVDSDVADSISVTFDYMEQT